MVFSGVYFSSLTWLFGALSDLFSAFAPSFGASGIRLFLFGSFRLGLIYYCTRLLCRRAFLMGVLGVGGDVLVEDDGAAVFVGGGIICGVIGFGAGDS